VLLAEKNPQDTWREHVSERAADRSAGACRYTASMTVLLVCNKTSMQAHRAGIHARADLVNDMTPLHDPSIGVSRA
jgi:hypothetical protein